MFITLFIAFSFGIVGRSTEQNIRGIFGYSKNYTIKKVAGTVFTIHILGLNSNIDCLKITAVFYRDKYTTFFQKPNLAMFQIVNISGHSVIGVFRANSCQKMI